MKDNRERRSPLGAQEHLLLSPQPNKKPPADGRNKTGTTSVRQELSLQGGGR